MTRRDVKICVINVFRFNFCFLAATPPPLCLTVRHPNREDL